MKKTITGKNGICIEFILPDDLSPGEKLQIIRKLHQIADSLHSTEAFERVVKKLGLTAIEEDN